MTIILDGREFTDFYHLTGNKKKTDKGVRIN